MLYLSPFRSSARLGAIFLLAAAFGAAHGQASFAYKDVLNMASAGSNLEESPYGGVTFDSSGNAYGTAQVGGADNNGGTLWELTSGGSFIVLHSFGGTVTNANGTSGGDGTQPNGKVTIDSHGNFFGTAYKGGPNGAIDGGFGMAWELTAGGTYIDLHDFGGTTTFIDNTTGPDGNLPYGNVSVDSSGDVFGTTTGGGESDDGIVWEVKSDGTYKDLHDFGATITYADSSSGSDGYVPQDGPTLDSSGDLFGTAQFGGEYSSGIVWEITSGGTYKDLHDFGNTVTLSDGTPFGLDGAVPYAGVTLDSSGNLYGCTTQGGGNNYEGMVWKLTSGGTYTDLHDCGYTVIWTDGVSGTDGLDPIGKVTLDSSGNVYGTTQYGGQHNQGIVWEVTAGGTYVDQHDFGGSIMYPNGSSGTDGENPSAGVTFDSSGNVWGTAPHGGASGAGLIFQLIPLTISTVSLSPSTIVGGYSSTGTITLNALAGRKTTISLTNQWPSYVTVPASVTVLEGANQVSFTASVSQLYAATFTNLITAALGGSSQSATLTVTGEKLASMTVSPTTMSGFGTSTGTITITNPAPTGGWVVHLKSALPTYVSVPPSVTVGAGATTANFTLTGLGAHVSSVTCSIYATDVASGTSASITLQGDSIASLGLNQSTIGWSGTSTGTVTLSAPAPAGGWVVNLSAGASGYLTMPPSVTVLEGATSATFSVTGAAQHSSSLAIRINASDGATSAFAILNLDGDSLSNLSLSPSSVAPGHGSTGTITLASPAPAGGWNVKLTVGAPSLVGVPSSVIVPAGATTVTFPLITYIGEPPSSVTVIANDGTSQVQTTLTIS